MTGRRRALSNLDTNLPDPAAVRVVPDLPVERSAERTSESPLREDEDYDPARKHLTPRPSSAEIALERKEVFLRASQRDQLAVIEARLRRSRPKGIGERITVNTLIRVAIDLLLTKEDVLAGYTEDELRRSVGIVTWRH